MTELEQLKKDHALLGERIAKLEKPEKTKLEKGKWYVVPKDEFFIRYSHTERHLGYNRLYGQTIFNERWNDDDYLANASMEMRLRPATPKEIEEALIKEAERRGFKEGAMFKCLEKGIVRPYKPYYKEYCGTGKGLGLKYFSDGDYLFTNDGLWNKDGVNVCSNPSIYREGKWAEIVKDEAIKIGGYEVEVDKGTNVSHIDGHTFFKSFWESALIVSKHPKAKIKIGCSHQFDLTTETIEKILSKF